MSNDNEKDVRIIDKKDNANVQDNFGQILSSITEDGVGAVKDTSPSPGFTPKPKVAPAFKPQTEETVTAEKLVQLEDMLRKLTQQGIGGVKVSAPKKPASLDFKKIREEDIYDLSVPIEAIDHSTPDYLRVELADSTYAPRWVNRDPRRLGPMIAMGWLYVEPGDLANSLQLAIVPDENGHLRFADTVLMKCEKVKYYGLLKRNHLRALAMVDRKNAHRAAAGLIKGDLSSSEFTDVTGKSIDGDTSKAGDYSKYSSAGKIGVYSPGGEIEL